MVGCCSHIYGSATGVNHNCQRLEGAKRHVGELGDGRNRLVKLAAGEGIGGILGRRSK